MEDQACLSQICAELMCLSQFSRDVVLQESEWQKCTRKDIRKCLPFDL